MGLLDPKDTLTREGVHSVGVKWVFTLRIHKNMKFVLVSLPATPEPKQTPPTNISFAEKNPPYSEPDLDTNAGTCRLCASCNVVFILHRNALCLNSVSRFISRLVKRQDAPYD